LSDLIEFSSKSTSASSSTTSITFVSLGDSSPRWLGIAQKLSSHVVESREVCIALLFMGIDSEEPNSI
jgi:hypothetical protein